MPAPKWMIEGLFEANSLVMLYGPPASYKSFLALAWILSMASGRSWMGKVTQPARILYVLGEGKASLLKRIDTWVAYNQLTEEEIQRLKANFRVTFEVPQIAIKASVDNMLADLEQEGYFPEVICVDTFARSFVGLDENSQKDTGLWVEQADRLRTLGYTVLFLHHSKKNTEFGLAYRGSTAIMGAMDTAIALQKDGSPNRVKMEVTKQKDHDEGDPVYFHRVVVTPADGGEGSIVLIPAPAPMDERFTKEGQEQEQALQAVMADTSFKSDMDRARALHQKFSDLSENAWQQRLKRRRERLV
jgi:hypothetical protein